jgi:hypothetical protein
MAQTRDAQPQQLEVLVGERLAGRAVGLRGAGERHPVARRVVPEREPVVEAAVVEQHRLVGDERGELALARRPGCRHAAAPSSAR